MTVLLLGASGLLGTHLSVRLPQSFDTFAPVPRDRTLASPPQVRWLDTRTPFDASAGVAALVEAIDIAQPAVIVNAVGVTPAAARRTPEGTLAAVNARFPHALADLAAARGARVVHVSSDAVFSGRGGNYRESDAPDPADAYGRSKLAGEIGAPHLTLRTSLFGRSARGAGVIEWLIARRGGTADGYADYRFSGVAAATLADLIVAAIERGLSGTYHVGGDAISKLALLRAAAAFLRLDVEVREVFNGPIDRTLDSTAFYAAIGRARPTLTQMVATLQSCPVPAAA